MDQVTRRSLSDGSTMMVEEGKVFLQTPTGDKWRELTLQDVEQEIAEQDPNRKRDIIMVWVSPRSGTQVETIQILSSRDTCVNYRVLQRNQIHHTPLNQMVAEGNFRYFTEAECRCFIGSLNTAPPELVSGGAYPTASVVHSGR